MKPVFVFTALFVALANAYPADKIDPSQVDTFDPFGGQEPIVDTGYFETYVPSLDSFYRRIQDIISGLRQTVTNSTSSLVPSFDDLGKGNTTSYTKIVGNHKIEVNETEYKKDTDFGTSHVKVSYINVRPLDSDSGESVDKPEPDAEPVDNKPTHRDREPLEDSVENEISNIDENQDVGIEAFDMVNSNKNAEEFADDALWMPNREPLTKYDNDISNDIDANISNDIDKAEPVKDLSNDLYVNDIMLADGAEPNPDAEYIFKK